MGVLRHELPDQQVLDHPIIANELIAPLVTMTCRQLLRRVASRGVLPRERFSPMDPERTSRLSARAELAQKPKTVMITLGKATIRNCAREGLHHDCIQRGTLPGEARA